ncbi:MAG: penicillin-binding protein 2 [Desulfobacterales bacterium]|nr:penicillin-binding protein 2 [Desulfobacterales bacterium]
MKKYLNTPDSDWYKQRLTGAIFILITVFSLLMARLFFLQVIEGQEFRRLSENNCIRLQHIDPFRGLIFDRNSEIMVDNRPSFDLGIVLKDAHPLKNTIAKLIECTNMNQEEIEEKIAKNKSISPYKTIVLKQDIDRNLLAAIEVNKFDLPGIVIDVRIRRHYIRGKSAAHLIGYLGEISSKELESGLFPESNSGELIGKFGVEKSYEKFLRGKRGGRQVEVNANGQIVRILNTVDAQPGYNTYLTIDRLLQEKAENLLGDSVGAVVAMDPNTGRILALANSPSFDPNEFVTGLSHQQWQEIILNPFRTMENKAIQAEYPPASTYKIITAMAGLEEGVFDEKTSIFCPGFYRFGDRDFRCWKKGGHGTSNVFKAIAESCDVFFYQVGAKLGVDRIAWYAKACGLGKKSGIDLDHEAKGLIPTAAWKKERTGTSWQRGETLSVAIGQGYNLTTPLQMLVLISAVANGGIIHKPQILERVATSNGDVVFVNEKQVAGKLPVSKKNLEIIRKGLWEVVNSNRGTAKIAKLKNEYMSGKTGTAQVVGRKKIENLKESEKTRQFRDHAWFVAYAPSENPKIAVAIIVEHGEHGSLTAAPIAQQLIETYLESGKID